MQKSSLRRVEKNERTGCSADEAGEAHEQGKVQIFFNVFAIGGDRGELAGPESHRVGGVCLNGQDFHSQHRRKGEEGAATGYSVEHPGQKGGNREPEPMPIDVGRKDDGGKHLIFIVEGGGSLTRFGRTSMENSGIDHA